MQFPEFEPIEPDVFDDLEELAADSEFEPEAEFVDYYAGAANDSGFDTDDIPLDERVRQVLMGNRTVRNTPRRHRSCRHCSVKPLPGISITSRPKPRNWRN